MANETTVQTSSIQENMEADECRENIPPGVSAPAGTSKLEVQVGGDVLEYSSTQPSGENEPLSDTCTFSTPAPSSNGGGKAKPRLSGLQSALTPILKYLTINNKSPAQQPLKHGNKSRQILPSFSLDNTATNSLKPSGGSSQHPSTDFSGSHSGRSLSDNNPPVCWLTDEYLPEITLLDVTCDTTMQLTKNDSALPDSVPSTPATTGSVSRLLTSQPSQLSSASTLNSTAPIPCPQKTLALLQSNVSRPKAECEAAAHTKRSGASYDVQDTPFDSLQKSSVNTVLQEADAFSTKPSTSSSSHQTTMDDSSSPQVRNPKENHKLPKYNGTTASKDPNAEVIDVPESIDAPLRWLDDRYFPEITLLDVTRDSDFSPGGEISSLEVTQDIPSIESLQNNASSSALRGHIVAESVTSDMSQSGDLSSTLDGNVTHTISSVSEQSNKSVVENTSKASLVVTRDISTGSVLEDSRPSLEPSGQNTERIQTSVEGTHDNVNVTHSINSSSDMSVQCAASQSSASDAQCNTSSKNVTVELPGEPGTSNSAEANSEELPTSHDAEFTGEVPQPNPKTTANSTFTIAEQSNLSASTSVDASPQTPGPQNKTLDIPPSNANRPKECDATDEATSVSVNTTETSTSIDPNCSAVKLSGPCDVQNVTFDKHSLQRSTGSTIIVEAATFNLKNNTFTLKQNATITVSETSSSDSRQNTLDKSPPPNVCNATSSPKRNNSEVQHHELSKDNGTTANDPEVKMVDTPESTFEANPVGDVAPGAGRSEAKDHSQSGLPPGDSLSDTFNHQSMDAENAKANSLNLDDTLDLRADTLITSTPMTDCKMFSLHTEREAGKIMAAQKKLYGDGPSKPDSHVPSGIPPNLVCDRKTFLRQPAAKSLLPPLKAASQLLKLKPASILPGKFEPLTSGLPMTRQRTQAEALRNNAASDAPHVTTGMSAASYNLRVTTTGFKQPNAGLRKPRMSVLPSGIQRAAACLKPPSARSNAPASASTDKLRAPAAANPASKISQAKKHPLTRGEALPVAKRKKMDSQLPSGGAETSTSSSDAAKRAKILKPPTATQKALPAKTQRDDDAVPASTAETSTSCSAVSRVRALKPPVSNHRALIPKPQSHGCAKCVVLQQQLEMKSEEIKRLKEELLKYSKPEEEC